MASSLTARWLKSRIVLRRVKTSRSILMAGKIARGGWASCVSGTWRATTSLGWQWGHKKLQALLRNLWEERKFTITIQRFVCHTRIIEHCYNKDVLSAHDEGSQDRRGMELAPGRVPKWDIYHAQWTRVPHLLSRTMDIGTEMDACYQRWHPSSWQLTSKKDLAALCMF